MRDPVTGETKPTELEGLLRERGIERVVVVRPRDRLLRQRDGDRRAPARVRDVRADRPVRAGQPQRRRRRAGHRADAARPASTSSADRCVPDRACSSTSSTRPTSCSARITRRGRRCSVATASSCRGVSGLSTSSSSCSARRARRTSGAPRTGSSSRSATTSSRATSRRSACRRDLLDQFPIAEAADRGARDRAVADGRVRGRRRDRRRRRPASPTTRRSSGSSICTPDKDMAQLVATSGSCCGTGAARSCTTTPASWRNGASRRASIPDWLALVGDIVGWLPGPARLGREVGSGRARGTGTSRRSRAAGASGTCRVSAER